MKKIVSFTIVIAFLVACSKNRNQQVTGRLMQSCGMPAANKNGIVRLPGGGILSKPSTTLEFTTDENGYFTVTHDEYFSDFSVRTSAAHSVLEASISEDEKELGEVYINPFPTNFVINLDVKNSYTENDTLVLLDYTDPDPFAQKLIPGPFQSGVLDTIVNHYHTLFPLKYHEIVDEGGPRNSIGFRLRSLPDFNINPPSKNFYIAPICSGEFAEVTLTID